MQIIIIIVKNTDFKVKESLKRFKNVFKLILENQCSGNQFVCLKKRFNKLNNILFFEGINFFVIL